MDEKFEWKAEVKFSGTAAEFNRFTQAMEAALKGVNITIEIPEWKLRPGHLAGCMPIPIDVLLGEERLRSIIHEKSAIQVNYIRDIRGGIRTGHLHLGDNVVLLDRATFKTVVSQVAQELAARRVEVTDDYVKVMSDVGRVGAIPIQLP